MTDANEQNNTALPPTLCVGEPVIMHIIGQIHYLIHPELLVLH